jgi:hypothetical protein
VGITSVSENLARDAEFMANRIFDTAPVFRGDDEAVIKVRDIEWRIVTPRGFSKLYPGCEFSQVRLLPATVGATIAVESVSTLRDILRKNAVDFVEAGSRTFVRPQDACNTLLEFVDLAEVVQ